MLWFPYKRYPKINLQSKIKMKSNWFHGYLFQAYDHYAIIETL